MPDRDGSSTAAARGPLAGLRVVELQGRGPGPFGAMLLADLGADVIRVTRPDDTPTDDDASDTERMLHGHRRIDLLARGRSTVAIDLKHPDGIDALLGLVDRADVLIDPFRPGVAERLGFGPEVCLRRNPRLIFARITGWGQSGPYAATPGHDLNYVALAGALDPLRRGPGEPPAPPLNLIGDFGGGGMLLAVGVLGALFERATSGQGQVIDVAMVDGVALLTTLFHGMRAEGLWSDVPGTNVLDLGAPFYNVYETSDERYVTIACGEPQFYARACSTSWVSDASCSPNRPIRRPGLPARRSWPRSSRRERSKSGASCSRVPTPPSPRSSGWPRPLGTRTTSTAAPSWRSTASSSPRPPPVQPDAGPSRRSDRAGGIGGRGPRELGLLGRRLASLRESGVVVRSGPSDHGAKSAAGTA